MINAYVDLHRLGYAHSLEVWRDGTLAGGLYGISLGLMFFGESMFSRESGASKAAFVKLVDTLSSRGFALIDCQVYTDHLASMGAENIDRLNFMSILENALSGETMRGSWSAEIGLQQPL